MAKKVPNGIESKTGDTAAILLIPTYFFALIKKRLVRVKSFFFLFGDNLRIKYSYSIINSFDKNADSIAPKKPALAPIKSILKKGK